MTTPREHKENIETIEATGFSILGEQVNRRLISQLTDEVSALTQAAPFCVGDFYGYKTKRVGGLLTKAPSVIELALHPSCLDIAAYFLECSKDEVRLSFTQAIEIHPSEIAQEPHIDQSMWPLDHAKIVAQVGFIWPLTNFTKANGATRVWPGSHHHADPDLVVEEDAKFAEMKPGSVLSFLGTTVHSGGANNTELPRTCVMIAYCRGWLKPFENQWLSYPREIASEFSSELATLVGYKIQHPNLGNVAGMCPSRLLSEQVDSETAFTDTEPE